MRRESLTLGEDDGEVENLKGYEAFGENKKGNGVGEAYYIKTENSKRVLFAMAILGLANDHVAPFLS